MNRYTIRNNDHGPWIALPSNGGELGDMADIVCELNKLLTDSELARFERDEAIRILHPPRSTMKLENTPPPSDDPEANNAASAGCMARLVRRCVSHHFACDCREARFKALLEDTIRAHSTPDNGDYNECDKDPCAWCKEAKALIYHGHPDGVPNADVDAPPSEGGRPEAKSPTN